MTFLREGVLFISESAVKTHVYNIFRKMNVKNRAAQDFGHGPFFRRCKKKFAVYNDQTLVVKEQTNL